MKKTIIVDFNKLQKENTRLLSGRFSGKSGYEFFKLNDFVKGDNIELICDSEFVITNAYFLGMFEDIFKLFDKVEDLNSIFITVKMSKINKEEFVKSIKRGFSPIKNPLS